MTKRRGEEDWYSLDFDTRKELMVGHGKVDSPSTAGSFRSSPAPPGSMTTNGA